MIFWIDTRKGRHIVLGRQRDSEGATRPACVCKIPIWHRVQPSIAYHVEAMDAKKWSSNSSGGDRHCDTHTHARIYTHTHTVSKCVLISADVTLAHCAQHKEHFARRHG